MGYCHPRSKMKKPVLFGLSFMLFLSAHGCQKNITPPDYYPTKKRVILYPPPKGRGFAPYIINGERYYPLSDSEGFVQEGTASWYGGEFHGRPTASGEIYDMYKISAAHKVLPLGTYVKAVNLANNRQIVVRINDRGPFVKGRIIDFSYGAAREMGLVGPGTARVKIVALGREVGEVETPQGRKSIIEIEDLNSGEFTVQVGAFVSKENALRLSHRLKVLFGYVDVQVYDDSRSGKVYRVRVSKSDTLTKAEEMEKRLESMGYREAFVVSL
jgi:rare lipoprotein A